MKYEATVTSSSRITIPRWIVFIEPEDVIEGFIQVPNVDASYPFEKKVSATRHITIGFIKIFLPDKTIPKRVNITITKVNKMGIDDFCFNLVSYKQDDTNFLMNFSSIKPNTIIQFKLDTLVEEYGNTYFERQVAEGNYFLEPIFEEKDGKWIISVYIPVQDDMGGMFPFILFFILSQECYQKYIVSMTKIKKLIQRLSNWIYNHDDLNKENLSKFSSQLREILEKGTGPNYLEMKEILKMPTLEREIILVVLKEHRNGGISLEHLAKYLHESQKNISEVISELANKGYIRQLKEKEVTIIDSLWII